MFLASAQPRLGKRILAYYLTLFEDRRRLLLLMGDLLNLEASESEGVYSTRAAQSLVREKQKST